MLKKRVVKISVLIGIAMLCFIGALSSLNVNAEYYQVQQGVSIHLNYDISTANDGKYANLLLNKNSDLSDYYKNYYSGGVVDFKNGYMYEADKQLLHAPFPLILPWQELLVFHRDGVRNHRI